MKKAILMHPDDNVATLLDRAAGHDVVEIVSSKRKIVASVLVLNEIPFGHKIAIADIGKNKDILKYGERIGISTVAITKGEHVHTQNVISSLGTATTSSNKEKEL